MAEPNVAPYGSWKSPITSELIAAGSTLLDQIVIEGEEIYWTTRRPLEGGRNVVVRRTADGRTADVTPPGFNVRSRVHEYGGGAFMVDDGVLYFSNFVDHRLYRQDVRSFEQPGAPQPITPEAPLRYADAVVDRRRGRIVCVREDHRNAGREPINTLVELDLEGKREARVLVSGNDFYASPRLSPDGTRLLWLTWNHPNMPWDGCELWVGMIEPDGSIGAAELVAGGSDESIFQPTWSPDGVLHFASDRTGWWNLYRWRERRIEPLHEMQAEFGVAQWVFGMSSFAFESAARIVCTFIERGIAHLATLDIVSGAFEPIPTPYTSLAQLRSAPGRAVFLGGSPTEAPSVIQLDLATRRTSVLQGSSTVEVDPAYISSPQPIEFPTEHGQTAHAFFYPPRNRDYVAPPGERPPLLLMSHGGPTSAATAVFNPRIQFWTSRGIAVLDVNYGGSSGYGRQYRRRLEGQWGIVDLDDCVNGARYLAGRGEVDGDRLAITGGSAGGYTTLCALTFRDVFKVGASYFGVGDLEQLVADTHKFESHYLDGLIGPYPAQRERYRERSPLNFSDHLSCPLILFQGLDDKVVPPNQAERMVAGLRAKGLPVAYIAFEGEGHGFRAAGTIKRALDAELYFYQRYLLWPDQPLPDDVVPVPLE